MDPQTTSVVKNLLSKGKSYRFISKLQGLDRELVNTIYKTDNSPSTNSQKTLDIAKALKEEGVDTGIIIEALNLQPSLISALGDCSYSPFCISNNLSRLFAKSKANSCPASKYLLRQPVWTNDSSFKELAILAYQTGHFPVNEPKQREVEAFALKVVAFFKEVGLCPMKVGFSKQLSEELYRDSLKLYVDSVAILKHIKGEAFFCRSLSQVRDEDLYLVRHVLLDVDPQLFRELIMEMPLHSPSTALNLIVSIPESNFTSKPFEVEESFVESCKAHWELSMNSCAKQITLRNLYTAMLYSYTSNVTMFSSMLSLVEVDQLDEYEAFLYNSLCKIKGEPLPQETLVQALEVLESKYHSKHYYVLQANWKIGEACIELKDYVGSIGYFEKAMIGAEDILDSCHPKLLNILDSSVQLGKYFGAVETFIPLEQSFIERAESVGLKSEKVAGGCLNLGAHALNIGENDKALELLQKSIKAYEEIGLPKHPNVAMGLRHLGKLCRLLNQPEQSLEYYTKSLALCRECQDQGHLLVNLHVDLGDFYLDTSQHELAEMHYLEGLKQAKLQKSAAGIDLCTRLGVTYMVLENYERAEAFHVEGLEIKEAMNISQNAEQDTALLLLSKRFYEIGDSPKAKLYLSKVDLNGLDASGKMIGLRLQDRLYGDVPKSELEDAQLKYAEFCSNSNKEGAKPDALMLYHSKIGRYQLASQTYLNRINSENEHASGADYYHRVSQAKFLESDFASAEEAALKSYSLRDLTQSDLSLYDSTFDLGKIYFAMRDNNNAEAFLHKSIEILMEMPNPPLGRLAYSCMMLGETYLNAGSFEQAKYYMMKSSDFATQLGDNEVTCCVWETVANYYKATSQLELACEYYLKFLELRKHFYDPNHPTNALAYGKLGAIYFKRQLYAEAATWLKKALKALDESDPRYKLTFYNNLGACYENLRQTLKAERNYLKALELSSRESSEELDTLRLLAQFYYKTNDLGKAEEYYTKVQEHPAAPSDILEYAQVLVNLGRVYFLLKDYKQAEERYSGSWDIYRQSGKPHPNHIEVCSALFIIYLKLNQSQKSRSFYDIRNRVKKEESLYDPQVATEVICFCIENFSQDPSDVERFFEGNLKSPNYSTLRMHEAYIKHCTKAGDFARVKELEKAYEGIKNNNSR
mmetsp:Transcript_22680/g.40828  ORF Transcript_22680/g.40828 Transcript_22680/m.40828 type:complete len:1152 (+) Transcript_22680:30-3485(+)